MLKPVRFDWADRESEDMEYRYVRYVDEDGQEYTQGIVTGPDGFLAVSHFRKDSTADIDGWFDTFEIAE